MPDRWCRGRGLTGLVLRTPLGIFNAFSVDNCRLCCIRRGETPEGELVLDSMLMLVESGFVVRGRASYVIRH